MHLKIWTPRDLEGTRSQPTSATINTRVGVPHARGEGVFIAVGAERVNLMS